jgi:hypothetical protein
MAESQGLRAKGRNGNFWQVHDRSPFFSLSARPLPLSPSRTLRNGRICQSMAVFWGGTDFVSEMSSEILSIDSVALTHRSASYEKRPHMLTPISAVDTCGRWLRSTEIQYVVDVRYAICRVSRARRCFGYFAIFREMSGHTWRVAHLRSEQSLTIFDTPGQFLTLGDKTGLFLAVFLKKVDVL